MLKIPETEFEKILLKKGTSVVKISKRHWGIFENPQEIIYTTKQKDIKVLIDYIESKVKSGFFCILSLSYDSSAAFDSANELKVDPVFPLLWAAFYKAPLVKLKYEDFPHSKNFSLKTTADISRTEYNAAITRIKDYIKNGDTYQVNFTFRINVNTNLNPAILFLNLFRTQKPEFGAFLNMGTMSVISLSPELFIHKKSSTLISKPMKGTISRGIVIEDDLQKKFSLENDPKNRAENLMITDMVRNDLGKICKYGTVKTKNLFNVITTPFVHQMISTVEGEIKEGISLFDILKALFPPASITGAPKIRSMQIIKELEKSPRGIYTGTIGMINLDYDFIFNVAIRTAVQYHNNLCGGIGGGIVADSKIDGEWKEAKLKSSFLISKKTSFEIFETILFDRKDGGFIWLDEHINRLGNSQKYFLRKFNRNKVVNFLYAISKELPDLAKVKISLDESGKIKCKWERLTFKGWGKKYAKVLISKKKTDPSNIMLYHKTTERKLYDEEFLNAQSIGYDDVIFLNKREEITEGAISNIFIKTKNGWLTPPLKCGLLPGIYRKHLILQLSAKEQIIYIKQLISAEKVIICNSVRGKIEVMREKK
ncbi:MAG TPA: aminodeoxychorismate synthase component I [Victivallales bacterium]|nr:aminodeoxychorismate synthase component I [Victivallales bacterium]HRR27810.1 aminodeoxychorismate synthase component I [Victivallales bacterium]HRU00076.1 aminodeoxychorismate synthase component I [Victivallales bacterium]